jgi:hypothetical protein
VITLLDAEAGGYAELAYGPADFEEELVLVVTLGKAMGAVLYKQGHRVRNTGMNTNITGLLELLVYPKPCGSFVLAKILQPFKPLLILLRFGFRISLDLCLDIRREVCRQGGF